MAMAKRSAFLYARRLDERGGRVDRAFADVQAIIDRSVLRVSAKNAVIGFRFQDELTARMKKILRSAEKAGRQICGN